MTEDELINSVKLQLGSGYRFRSRKPVAALPQPATESALLEAEAVLKGPLPSLLRRIYLEVANGGFGPGFGILGVGGGWTDDLGQNLVDLARKRTRYRRSRVYFCYLGGAMYYHCDITGEDAPVSQWTEGDHVPISPSIQHFFETEVLGLEEYNVALRLAVAVCELHGYESLASEWSDRTISCDSADMVDGPNYRCDVTVVSNDVPWDAPAVLEIEALLVERPDGAALVPPVRAVVHMRADGAILEP